MTNETIRTMTAADAKKRLPRGVQSHGPAGSHIGGIAGCISMKARDNGQHYVCAVDAHDAENAPADKARIAVFAKTKGASHFAHCLAHGVQVACRNRAAAIQTCRTAGAFNPKAGKAAAQAWCARCVKAQQAQADEA